MTLTRTALVAAAFVCVASLASADEVTDALQAAGTAYQEGKLSDAKRQADTASVYLSQKLAERLKGYLPAAIDGWGSNDGESNAMPAGMFGGGMTANRRYTKDDLNVELTIMADSPMLATIMMMVSNPQMAAMSGGRLLTVAGQQGVISSEGEVQLVVANRFYITVSGSAAEADKLAYANLIDYTGLAAF